MAPKRLLLLAASIVAALDAPASLQNTAREDDFVALKFDVDNDFSLGPTMEWGFLADLLRRCLLYTSPSPRDQRGSRMPSSA